MERNVADAMRTCEMYFNEMILSSAVVHPVLVTYLVRPGEVRRDEVWRARVTGWMGGRVGGQVVSSWVGECVRGRAGGLVCE